MARLCVLILSVASSTVLAQYNQPSPIVTSAPLQIFESSKFSQYPSPTYSSENTVPVPIPIHQTSSLPVQISQSYALPPVPSQYQHPRHNTHHNYYPSPQYPSYVPHHQQQPQPHHQQQHHLGYTNINTIGTPYQMYSHLQQQQQQHQQQIPPPPPPPTLPSPLFTGGFIPQPWRPAPTHQQVHQTIRTKPQSAYAPPNTQLLGNLPAASSVYGSPIDPSSSLPEKSQPRYTSPSPIDDTWEALEASIDDDKSSESRK